MKWFSYFLDLINLFGSEMPNFVDNLRDIFFGTVLDGYYNSGLEPFFDDIPLIGDVVNTVVKWLLSAFGDYTLLSFILSNGIGFIIFATLIKWVLGFVKK